MYLLMGVAAFLVWRKGLQLRTVRMALGWFLVQLVLNALWTPVFFGLHHIGWAFAVIVLLWVSFATVLNGSIWRLNS